MKTYRVEFIDETGITGGSIRTVRAHSHIEALQNESQQWAPKKWALIESSENRKVYALRGGIITACVEEKK